ncbi:MAG: hypothetical protein V1670_03185 [Candidatus Omnitrophota bacterium]
MLRFNKKGQNTAEYAIVIALVLGAAIAMQTYVKRSMQGGVKFAVDKLQSTEADSVTGGQYEPYYLRTEYDTSVGGHTDSEETVTGGGVLRTSGNKTTSRTGYQQIGAVGNATGY